MDTKDAEVNDEPMEESADYEAEEENLPRREPVVRVSLYVCSRLTKNELVLN